MKIIIVGLGKVGYAIAQQMVGEEHDLILVDESAAVIEHADATLDAMCVEGNGACASVLLRAGVRDADLVIAATADDEVNLVCSLMAKKLGAKHTVARVRNPEYFRDAPILRREIGLDMIINPENAAAQEISRILRVPSAFSVETFARGLVELIGFQTEEGDSLVGKLREEGVPGAEVREVLKLASGLHRARNGVAADGVDEAQEPRPALVRGGLQGKLNVVAVGALPAAGEDYLAVVETYLSGLLGFLEVL